MPVFCLGQVDWADVAKLEWPGDDGDRLVHAADAVALSGPGGNWLFDRALLLRARQEGPLFLASSRSSGLALAWGRGRQCAFSS